jgi:hypothetical protein
MGITLRKALFNQGIRPIELKFAAGADAIAALGKATRSSTDAISSLTHEIVS